MQCPKCDADMEKVTYENIEVDRCTGCAGIWFDMLEAEKLKEIKGSETIDTGDAKTGAEYDKKQKIDCPKCKTPMIRMVDRSQPRKHFESCTVCYGLFFDAGEFADYKQESVLDFFKGLMG